MVLGLALGVLAAGAARADEAPGWLREALGRPIPESAAGAPAVVLELENRLALGPSGKVVENERGAVRIATREGAEAAQANVHYCLPEGKVRDIRGWIVEPGGAVKTLSSGHEIDQAMLDGGLYDEYRIRRLIAVRDVVPGSVFAYEWTCEQTKPFAQFEWQFQDERPVLRSRFILELPPGWAATSLTFNHEPLEPKREDGRLVWELRDLPEISDEPWRPVTRSLVPRLSVNAIPPAGRPVAGAASFREWGEVSRWLDGIAAPSGAPDDAVRARAQRLAAGARSELDTLRMLGRSAQEVLYASIQIGVSRGGGYRPRPPGQVMARGYGDCKDKANLMRSLLAAVGRPAFLVSVHAGDPTYVSHEWPSPAPFNHCIVAVPLRTTHDLPAEVGDPHFGRLLIFDPTDPSTAIGDLPPADQGGLALLVSPEAREPFRLPELAPEASRVERRVELELDAEGGAEARLTERCTGNAAVRERADLGRLNRTDYRNAVERWIHGASGGAEVRQVRVRDDTLGGRFETEVSFKIPHFAQLMQSRLMVVRPLLLARLGAALAEDHPRRYPVVLSRHAVRETLVVHLPPGFAVDELPDSSALDTPFASFTARVQREGDALRLARALTVRRRTVPLDQFGAVRDFYARVRTAEEAPVVLARE